MKLEEMLGKWVLIRVHEIWRGPTLEEHFVTDWLGQLVGSDGLGWAVVIDPELGQIEYPPGYLFPSGGMTRRHSTTGEPITVEAIGCLRMVRTGTRDFYDSKSDFCDTAERVFAALNDPQLPGPPSTTDQKGASG